MQATTSGVRRKDKRICALVRFCWGPLAVAVTVAGVFAAEARGQEPPPSVPSPGVSGNAKPQSPPERNISQILPFADYLPASSDPKRSTDPCDYLCPRPNGAPCDLLPGDGKSAPTCPSEISLGEHAYLERSFDGSMYMWEASQLFSNPLYFEDPPLERYGHSHHKLVQPFVSAGRFGTQLIGLPYQMAIDPICKKMYALGWYRPGECVPHKHYQIPLNAKAAIVQGSVVTGLIFLIP